MFHQIDLVDFNDLLNVITDYYKLFTIDVIIHLAGLKAVSESIQLPMKYYEINLLSSINILKLMSLYNVKKFIFSSSAAVYGEPIFNPCQEIDPAAPISPYGQSKLMIDWMLQSYQKAYGLDFVSFRYFNACGADSQARHGQALGASHIIARVLESVKNNTDFTLYGTSYSTDDGTCVRDYIHVEDLAQAHILAVDTSIPGDIYNLGTNTGNSNLAVIQLAAQIVGKDIPVLHGPQREGDPAILTADAGKFMSVSTWKPQFNLEDMIAHAWAWYNR
jgi:UDP-glucose 4-epimerase